ncbi:hypothetical protein JCM3766R1_005347, partial [Sporobolomyces carnicolor]
MLRSTALVILASTLALASPVLEPRAAPLDQVVLDGVSWGANKLSAIGTTAVGDVGTLTKWDWTDCGSPSDALQIDSIKISPDPPKPGQDLTIVASGRAQSKID